MLHVSCGARLSQSRLLVACRASLDAQHRSALPGFALCVTSVQYMSSTLHRRLPAFRGARGRKRRTPLRFGLRLLRALSSFGYGTTPSKPESSTPHDPVAPHESPARLETLNGSQARACGHPHKPQAPLADLANCRLCQFFSCVVVGDPSRLEPGKVSSADHFESTELPGKRFALGLTDKLTMPGERPERLPCSDEGLRGSWSFKNRGPGPAVGPGNSQILNFFLRATYKY